MGGHRLTGYKKFMSDLEIKYLLKYINTKSEPIKLIFYILIFMGLRVGEVCTLKRENIQGNRLVFKLKKSGRTHERVIPNWLNNWIQDYMIKFKILDGWLFPTTICKQYNGHNKHIVTSSIGAYIKRFRDTYGLRDVYYRCKDGKRLYRISVHTIRHWFLCKLYEKCGDLLLVAQIIGHKKFQTTFDYIMAWKKQEREQELVDQIAIQTL